MNRRDFLKGATAAAGLVAVGAFPGPVEHDHFTATEAQRLYEEGIRKWAEQCEAATMLAMQDLMIFGIGAVFVAPSGEVTHVPAAELRP